MSLDELEAVLHDRYDDDTLAVYADELQRAGDPRGELIALDLHGGDATGERRGELVRECFGPDVKVWLDGDSWFAGDPDGGVWATVERGLVELGVEGAGPAAGAILARAGRFLHRVSISGSRLEVKPVVDALVGEHRPWMRDLAIRVTTVEDWAIIEGDVLVTTMPRLEALDVAGVLVVKGPAHPAVLELGLHGVFAYYRTEGAWRDARLVDFAYELADSRSVSTAGYVFAETALPRLRELRLARNEPGHDMFALLPLLPIVAQLTRVTLPALRSARDVELVQTALDRMPLLREVHVARTYDRFGDLARELRHAEARIRTAAPWPWPPRDQGFTLVIDEAVVQLGDLVAIMEEQYDALAEDAQAFWYGFWSIVDRFQYSERIAAVELRRGLDALELDERGGWADVRRQLQRLERGTVVLSRA